MGENKLNHVGVIMDGNRRWAKKQGLKSVLMGHEKVLSGKLNDVPSGRLFRADLGSLQIG